MDNGVKQNGILAFRGIQVLGILAVVIGAMWQTADSLKLTIPQYLMLYGAMWAIISEVAIQVLKYKFREVETPKRR